METGTWKLETGTWKLETGNWELENANWKLEKGNIYEAIEQYSRQGKIAYIHLRNVIGKAPHYRETFIDEGDVDMIRLLSILKRNAFKGVIIPDHTPQMSCTAPWHAGMTHTLGFVLAVLAMLESPSTQQDKREVRADS